MTRTTNVLRRVGMAGLATVLLTAGVPALIGTPAQAAGPATAVSITPATDSGSAGSCLNYTVTARDSAGLEVAGATVTVIVTDTTTPASTTQDVQFCTGGDAASGTSLQSSSTAGGSDTSRFTTGASGTVVVGVTALQVGSASVRPFLDSNGNGALDANEASVTATATFTTGGPAGSNAARNAVTTVAATPTADTAIVGEARTFRVTLTNAAGDTVAGVAPTFTVAGASTQGPTDCAASNNAGVALCTVTVNTAGTSTVTFFVNQTDGATTSAGLDGGEPSDTSTLTASAAPSSAFVVRLTCNADTGGANAGNPQATTAAGTTDCSNDLRDTSRSFTATVFASSAANAPVVTTGVQLAFAVTGGGTDATVTPTEATTNASGTATVTVTDPTVTSGQVLTLTATIRGTGSNDTAGLTFVNAPSDARFVSVTPPSSTVVPGSIVAVTATVTDVDGRPVRGVTVNFSETGAGRFVTGAGSATATTDAAGRAVAEVTSASTETGQQVVTADITGGNQCAAAAGRNAAGATLTGAQATAAAGRCTGTSTVNYTAATASPTAAPTTSPTTSPTVAPTATATATATPTGGNVVCPTNPPAVTFERATITATGSTGVTVTGAPANSAIDLLAYSQPSRTFRVVRSAQINAAGAPAEFRIVPPTNTRVYAQVRGCTTDAARFSVVLNVRTQLSLNVVRNGERNYTFSGRALPARAGGLIVSLYRVTPEGRQILTSQTRAAASTGAYTIVRQFTGEGRFGFVVRTGQDLQNAPGSSNVRSLAVF